MGSKQIPVHITILLHGKCLVARVASSICPCTLSQQAGWTSPFCKNWEDTLQIELRRQIFKSMVSRIFKFHICLWECPTAGHSRMPLDTVMLGRTTLVIAHRLSALLESCWGHEGDSFPTVIFIVGGCIPCVSGQYRRACLVHKQLLSNEGYSTQK